MKDNFRQTRRAKSKIMTLGTGKNMEQNELSFTLYCNIKLPSQKDFLSCYNVYQKRYRNVHLDKKFKNQHVTKISQTESFSLT